jgi:hypothetical protein
VELAAGAYAVDWYSVGRRETIRGGAVTVERHERLSFTPRFGGAGPSVLYLKRVGD